MEVFLVSKLTIKSNLRDYDVFFESNSNFIKELAQKPNSVYIIDENVYSSHRDLFSVFDDNKIIILPISEERKNITTVCELYEKIMTFDPRKNMNLITAVKKCISEKI